MTEDTNASTDAGTTTADAGKTFTQADLDRIVGERIARERSKLDGVDIDDLKSKAQKLAELEAAQQTDAQRLEAERDDLKGKLTPLQQENARLRVAMEKKLDASLIDRLRGSTREELETDADKLLELFSPTPQLDGGARRPAPATGDMDSIIRHRAGRS